MLENRTDFSIYRNLKRNNRENHTLNSTDNMAGFFFEQSYDKYKLFLVYYCLHMRKIILKKNKINLIWILFFTQTSFCTDNSQYYAQSLSDISRGESQRQFIEISSVKRKDPEENNNERKKQKMASELDETLSDEELRMAFEKLETMPCAFAEFDETADQEQLFIPGSYFNIFITFMKGALSIDLTKPVFNNQTLCVAIIESEYNKLLKNISLNHPQIESQFTNNFIIEDDWNEKTDLKNTVFLLEKMQKVVNEMNEIQSKNSLTKNKYARLACKAFSGIFYIIFQRFSNEYSNYEYYEQIKGDTEQIFNAIRDEYIADVISAEFMTINSSLDFTSDVLINLAKAALLVDLKKKVWSNETFCCGLIESIINLYKLYDNYDEAEKAFLEEVANICGRNDPSSDPLEIMKKLISEEDLYSASEKRHARLIFRGVAEIFYIVFERYFKEYPEDPDCDVMKLSCWQKRDSRSKNMDASFDEASIVIIEKSKLDEINWNKASNSKNEWEEFDKWGKKWVQIYDNMKEMEELFDKVHNIFKKESYHRNECF